MNLATVQVAGRQQRLVVPAGPVAAALPHLPGRDEPVHVVEPLVVAHVRHHVPVPRHHDVGALVLEPAERRVLHRLGLRLRAGRSRRSSRTGWARWRTPAAWRPSAGRPQRQLRESPWGPARSAPPSGGAGGDEVLVEVLLARQHRAPRRRAAGAVVHRPADPHAGGVRDGPQQGAARAPGRRRRTRCRGDPAVVAAPALAAPTPDRAACAVRPPRPTCRAPPTPSARQSRRRGAGGNMMFSLVYSWLATSRPAVPSPSTSITSR